MDERAAKALDLRALLANVEALASAAGAAIMAVYARDFAVEEKGDSSPLTEADSAAHRLIAAGLARLTPDIPVLSEEDVENFVGPDSHGRYWLVDPLDGTKEFIKRNGEFTVNIALIENSSAVLGVVYAPAKNVIYAAAKGCGAVRRDEGGTKKIAVADRVPDTEWRVVGSRSHAGDQMATFLQHIGAHRLVPMGSSLKLCLVAENTADLYPRLGPTSLWDTAAAQCVVEQAGGAVVDLGGEALDYSNPRSILNPWFLVHARAPEFTPAPPWLRTLNLKPAP